MSVETTRSPTSSTVAKYYGLYVKKHLNALDQCWYDAYANLDLSVPETPRRDEPLPMLSNNYLVPTFFAGMGLNTPFSPAFLACHQQRTNHQLQLSRSIGPLVPDAGELVQNGDFSIPIQRPLDMTVKIMKVGNFQEIPYHAFPSFVHKDVKESTWHPKTDLCRDSYG